MKGSNANVTVQGNNSADFEWVVGLQWGACSKTCAGGMLPRDIIIREQEFQGYYGVISVDICCQLNYFRIFFWLKSHFLRDSGSFRQLRYITSQISFKLCRMKGTYEI